MHGMRNELSEEVAVGVVRGLCCLRQLSGKKPSVPVRPQLITL